MGRGLRPRRDHRCGRGPRADGDGLRLQLVGVNPRRRGVPIDSPGYALDVQTAMANYLQGPGEQAHLGRAVLRAGVDDDGVHRQRTDLQWHRQLHLGQLVDPLRRRGRRCRREGPALGLVGQVPLYTYRSTTYDEQVQAYYDDAVSLDVKHELIIANGLRGVGIWHSDGRPRRKLWDQLGGTTATCRSATSTTPTSSSTSSGLAAEGITTGCGNERFCPLASVTRARDVRIPGEGPRSDRRQLDRFSDDNDSVYESSINRIAEAGITSGCTSSRFCPDRVVTRAQMASFIDRALDLPRRTSTRSPMTRDYARERDQPTGGRGDRDRVRLKPVLPIEPGQPGADGCVPPSGARSVATPRGTDLPTGMGARSAYGTHRRRLGTVARVLIRSVPGALSPCPFPSSPQPERRLRGYRPGRHPSSRPRRGPPRLPGAQDSSTWPTAIARTPVVPRLP